MKYRSAAQTAQNDWNTQLRRENAKLKSIVNFQKEFDSFITKPGIDCFMQWNYSKWEVRILMASPYGDWSVFKQHEEREKSMSMALCEAKGKVSY